MKIRPLSPELAEKARRELNENPERIEEDVQHMKDWVAKQPHLRACTDDQWLAMFLRGCKFSLERTKEKFDLYYTMRTQAPELCQVKYNEAKFMEILELGSILILPKKQDDTSPRVMIMRPGAYDPNKYQMSEIMSVSGILQQILMYDCDSFVVAGVRGIADMTGLSAAHLMQMSPMFVKKMIVLGQDATPMRMKGMHYINTPSIFETVFNLVKGFLNEKNKSRLYVHNKNYDELYQHIPRDILPAEYGGNGGTIKEIIEYWKGKVKEYSSWLEEDLKFGSDESKRRGKPKTSEELFGVEGSFRKLAID